MVLQGIVVKKALWETGEPLGCTARPVADELLVVHCMQLRSLGDEAVTPLASTKTSLPFPEL
jgi:hypothetical protein